MFFRSNILFFLAFFSCNIHCAKIIGLVPVRNESLVIAQYLKSLSLYSDGIIVLDDASEDNTVEIIKSLADECNVLEIIVKDKWYLDEPGDRNKLLQAGRAHGGTHFILIDADEMFSATSLKNNALRNKILSLKPGQRIQMYWIELWRNCDQFILGRPYKKDFIFCDDGVCCHKSDFVHTPRVPNLKGEIFVEKDYLTFNVLHFCSANLKNRRIKTCWYMCLEKIRTNKSAQAINYRYEGDIDETNLKIYKTKKEWFDYSFFDAQQFEKPDTWRKQQVLDWFKLYGTDFFKDLNIWDVDWFS